MAAPSSAPRPPHAVLKSGSTALVFDVGLPPTETPDWRSYAATLTVGAWRVGNLAGAVATVLGALTGLFLAGEFVIPVTAVSGLDAVSLAPVPLPAAAWAMLSAPSVLGLRGQIRCCFLLCTPHRPL